MSTLMLILLVLAVLGCILGFLIRKLTMPATVSQCDPSWINGFSVEKYRPMLRLLSDDDESFLSGQPGFEPKMWNKLRRERRKIFRAYLRNLVRDFHRLHLAGRMILVYSEQDRPELASALMQQRLLFTWAVLSLQFRLTLHALGVGGVDVQPLVQMLESMRTSIGQLTPVSQPSAA